MSKVSWVERNQKRADLIVKKRDKRAQLKAIIMDKSLPAEERFAAQLKLAKMPRNSSRVRYRLRCSLTGRARGNYRKSGLCRIKFRELASQGVLPGVVKSSW